MSRLLPVAIMLFTPAIASAQTPAAAPAPTQAATSASADKIKCHSTPEIGSLARVRKECHTAAEWREIAEANRNGARTMIDRSASAGIGPQ